MRRPIIEYEEYCDSPIPDSSICIITEQETSMHESKVNEVATQWSSVGDSIIAVSNTFKTLESGYYSINYNSDLGLYFTKDKIELSELHKLPNKATEILLNDINKFWGLEDTYKKYGRVFKRNYLIYSEPGTGKTSLINLMCQDLIEKYDGIIFSLNNERELELFPDAIKRLRKIEPDRKVITIIEDIDNFCDYRNGSLNTLLLNILDGNLKTNNLVVIATTNHIEKMEGRYTNRPSRFDRVMEFPLPNDESRRIFIEKTVKPEDISKINIDEWVNKTNGYTIDHINELILLYFVFGHDEDESFETMDNMVRNNNNLHNTSCVNSKTVGF